MNKNKRKLLAEIEAAMDCSESEDSDLSSGTVGDLVSAILKEPDKKKRKQMIKDFTARHKDAADFLAKNENLINSEAEAALISAAVGRTTTDKKISYKGGRKNVEITKKRESPNTAALTFLLKNRMPDRYSDKPVGETEIEDTADIKEEIENAFESDEEDEGG